METENPAEEKVKYFRSQGDTENWLKMNYLTKILTTGQMFKKRISLSINGLKGAIWKGAADNYFQIV